MRVGPQCSQHWQRNLAPNIAPRRRGAWIPDGETTDMHTSNLWLVGVPKFSIEDKHSVCCDLTLTEDDILRKLIDEFGSSGPWPRIASMMLQVGAWI